MSNAGEERVEPATERSGVDGEAREEPSAVMS
jgi:hypothetical protein